MASYEFITFRLETEDDGTCTLTIIDGGSHRGGLSRGRLSWTGGLDVGRAHDVQELIAQSVLLMIGGIQGTLLQS